MPRLRAFVVPVLVLVLLALIDVVLFQWRTFWMLTPDFGNTFDRFTWTQVYSAARQIEMYPPSAPRPSLVLGDSAIVFGVDSTIVQRDLRDAGVNDASLILGINGARASDSALLAWTARRVRPWVVVVGLGTRDFTDDCEVSPVLRTFYDASIDLPMARTCGVDASIDAYVRRVWLTYRYRGFARAVMRAQSWFGAEHVTVSSFRVWQQWRATRRFDDYVRWLNAKGSGRLLAIYESNVAAERESSGELQFASLAWMLDVLRKDGIRVVLADTPENPQFLEPAARPYFDVDASDRYAERLARLAELHGARFVDLRRFLVADDFLDLIHTNLVGERKLSTRIAALIAEESRSVAADDRFASSRVDQERR